jgi:hypothetical protein
MKGAIFSSERLRHDIVAEGRAIGMAEGAAEIVAGKTVAYVEKWARGRGQVTSDDIKRTAARKLCELAPDLGYVYENRGKIL